MIAMNPAPNLVLVGPMGAGKTSIGRRLAERFALAFVDADREIETQAGANIATIFECEGEAGFRARERDTLARLLAGETQLIATGGGAVLDAGTRALLRTRGFVVHLHVSVDGQLQRLARDRVRPLLQHGDRVQVLQDLARLRAPLYAEVADLVFDTEGLAATDAAHRLGEQLQALWTRGAAA
jgi:shikimate kinase